MTFLSSEQDRWINKVIAYQKTFFVFTIVEKKLTITLQRKDIIGLVSYTAVPVTEIGEAIYNRMVHLCLR